MYVPTVLPTQMQTIRPSKRKIVKTIYTTEKFANKAQKELPKELHGFAKWVSESCHNARNFMTKVN